MNQGWTKRWIEAKGPLRQFPEGFLLGAGTSAYQIEGGAAEDGRSPSIWDTFSHTPGKVLGGDTGDVACDHYHRFEEDVAIMADLGLDVYRFSASWSRVCPDGTTLNRAGADFYSRLVDQLLERGIRPWLTLYHWDLPQILEDSGGWLNRDTAFKFRDYAMALHDVLGDRVTDWTTLNEPWCASFVSYTAGEHAPGHTSVADGLVSAHHLLLAHGLGIEALREQNQELDLGITLNLTLAQPANPDDPRDVDACRRIDGQVNRWFLDPVFEGHYPVDIVEDFRRVDPSAVEALEAAIHTGDLNKIAAPIDSFGINYYHGEYLLGREIPEQRVGVVTSPYPDTDGIGWLPTGLPQSDMGWDIDPLPLTEVIARVHREYTGPAGVAIYVTENGIATADELVDGAVDDPERMAYLLLHLGAVLDALEDGADVRGYFYWSLLDNFEWAFGYSKRFGLVYVDFDSGERVPKASAVLYGKVLRNRAIPIPRGAGAVLRRESAFGQIGEGMRG